MRSIIYLRINSHRARQNFDKLGIPFESKYNFHEGHFYLIDETYADKIENIKGIKKVRKPKHELYNTW